jgi:hypothetical protein
MNKTKQKTKTKKNKENPQNTTTQYVLDTTMYKHK